MQPWLRPSPFHDLRWRGVGVRLQSGFTAASIVAENSYSTLKFPEAFAWNPSVGLEEGIAREVSWYAKGRAVA